MTARATVVIVGFNSRPWLERGLPALLDSLGPDDGVVVVDNASTDGTTDFLAERHPSVRAIAAPSNAGFGAGSNPGARAADSEFLVFLNPDTEVERGWLEPLLDALAADEVALATSQIVLMDDPNRLNALGNRVHYCGLALCNGLGRPVGERAEILDAGGEVAAVSGAAFAVRREVFDALGGFDEEYFLYVEDTDLSLRARLAGHRIVCATASVVRHDYRLRVGPDKIFLQERNRYRTLLKTYRAGTLVLLAPALLLTEIVGWAFVALRDRGNAANKLRAYASVARDYSSWSRARRRTQASRRIADHELLAALDAGVDYAQVERSAATAVAGAVVNPLFVAWKFVVAALLRALGV